MPTETLTWSANDCKIGYISQVDALSNAMVEFGCSLDEVTEAVKQMADLMKAMDCANARIDYLEYKLSQLEPAPDAKIENPKQKSDLEIFSRIEPSEDFLKLEGNMFIS